MAKNVINSGIKQISNLLTSGRKKHNKNDEKKQIVILITGPPRSGKSTFFRQLKRILTDDGKTEEKSKRRADIRKYVIESITIILTTITMPVTSLRNLAAAAWLKHNLKKPIWFKNQSDLSTRFSNLPKIFNFLWMDKEMKRHLLIHIFGEHDSRDNLEYFFEKIEVIFSSDYTPTDEDVLRYPCSSTKLEEIEIHDCYYDYKITVIGNGENKRGLLKNFPWFKETVSGNYTFPSRCVTCIIMPMVDCSSPGQLCSSFTALRDIRLANASCHQIFAIVNKVHVFTKRILLGESLESLFSRCPEFPRRFREFTRDVDVSNLQGSERDRQVLIGLNFLQYKLQKDYLYCYPDVEVLHPFGYCSNGYRFIEVVDYLNIKNFLLNNIWWYFTYPLRKPSKNDANVF